jgi:hypothetical protein
MTRDEDEETPQRPDTYTFLRAARAQALQLTKTNTKTLETLRLRATSIQLLLESLAADFKRHDPCLVPLRLAIRSAKRINNAMSISETSEHAVECRQFITEALKLLPRPRRH